MSEERSQPKMLKKPSLNEIERRLIVDRINQENGLLLSSLKNMTPLVPTRSQTEQDFSRHLLAQSHLRRKQFQPLSSSISRTGNSGDTFNADSYFSQQSSILGENDDLKSPIKNLTEFRRSVINKKYSTSISPIDTVSSYQHKEVEFHHNPT